MDTPEAFPWIASFNEIWSTSRKSVKSGHSVNSTEYVNDAISGKVIWITGASSGIGKALAQTAAQQNTKLILSGRRVDALELLASELPVDCLVLPFEVTDYDVLASKVDEAWACRAESIFW